MPLSARPPRTTRGAGRPPPATAAGHCPCVAAAAGQLVPAGLVGRVGRGLRLSPDPSTGPRKEAAAKKLPFVAAEYIRHFNDQRQLYQRYNTIKTLLRNMILKSVEYKYTKALKHTHTKYQQLTPLALMDHL